MLDELFNIEQFNIYTDKENYYFFRALEDIDLNNIKNKTIIDENNNITKLITDREYYGETRFKVDSKVSLDEVYNHIKMHYYRHTNCISFSSNANTVLTYGRQDYEDKYVILKVPKSEFGKNTFFAPLYMLKEVEKEIDKKIKSTKLDQLQEFYLTAIENASTQEQLDRIKETLPKEYAKLDSELFEGGINYNNEFTDSSNYQALDKKQNLLKNKIILKIDILNKTILPNATNKFLIQTIGGAIASQEVINYKDVDGKDIISVPKEMIDVLSLVQQLDKNDKLVIELKQELIKYFNNNKNINLDKFNRENDKLKEDITIEDMYNLTNGSISYGEAMKLYKTTYNIAKSKLRCLHTCKLLKQITNNNPKYSNLIDQIKNNCYGIEGDISNRLTGKGLQLSEGVNLDIRVKDIEFVNQISSLEEEKLNFILDNPLVSIKKYVKEHKFVKEIHMKQYEYYANAIIDLFDFNKIGISINFSDRQRQDIVDKLLEKDFIELYNTLKDRKIKEKNISNILLTTIIKEKDVTKLTKKDLYDTFTIPELEHFIGYNRIKGTKLKLRNYQRLAFNNINKKFKMKKFTTAVLPTGAGKSFVALAEMYKYRNFKANEGILYLAPNDEILNQLKAYIWDFYVDKSINKSADELIQDVFPGLVLSTYAYLNSPNATPIINHKYNLIICDELHRTGATISNKNIDILFKNQDDKTKILGITATPLRDADSKNMARYWAKYFDYTDDEIDEENHLSINLDIFEAIDNNYIVNPKVVGCEYNLLNDGHMESLLDKIEQIKDENTRKIYKQKYKDLRRKLNDAKGVNEIYNENIKPGGKYIVFCPVTYNGKVIEDENGNIVDKVDATIIMKKYMDDLKEELKLFAETNNLSFDSDIEITSMLGAYSSKDNKTNLNNFNRDEPNKTKFIVVMNKLNEGVHVRNINGIIWKRPLSESSRILYLQQLGRCIYGLDPNKEYKDEDRPVVIDLVNNTLNVALSKEQTSLEKNLSELISIKNWCNFKNRMPDLNSFDIDESKMGVKAKLIQSKFSMYLDNNDLFKTLSKKDVKTINNILNIGREIDLWDYEFDSRDKLTNEEKLEIYIEMLNENYEPDYYDPYTNFKNTSIHINQFLKINLDLLLIPKLFFELKDDNKYETARNKILNFLGIEKIEDYINSKDENSLFQLTGLLRDFYDLNKDILNNRLNIIDWVRRIQEYCKTYKEWPKYAINNKSIDGVTSNQLAQWLYGSGYTKGEFKYSGIKDETGKLIKEILDELYLKYGRINRYSDEAKIMWVKKIQDYCNLYHEWPNINEESQKNILSDGTTSKQLALWLDNTSGYSKGKFKYPEIKDETGKYIKDILDELYLKYGRKSRQSDEAKIMWVKKIQEYCQTYEEWPKTQKKDNKIDGITSDQLAQWLHDSGYTKGEFKYSGIKDETGKYIKEILDELYLKYGNIEIIQTVKKIQEYCNLYHEWPKKSKELHKNILKDGTTSTQLVRWLYKSGYTKGEFKYSGIKDETGKDIKDILDELFLKYGNKEIIQKVKQIQEYCKEFRELPNGSNESKKYILPDGTTSKQLVDWLHDSGYIKGVFKYSGIKDETGKDIKEILDELYLKYGKVSNRSDETKIMWVKKIQEYCDLYHEWPKYAINDKSIDGVTSNQLAQWLFRSGYTKGEFKYSGIKDEIGKDIKDILDELYEKYVLNKENIMTEKKELIALKKSLLEQQNETIKNKKL